MVTATNGPPVLNGPAYVYPSKTLAQLREDLLCMLGFPDPLTSVDSETKTLIWLREKVFRRLGHYYVAGSMPPGTEDQVDAWISEAQQTIFRTTELDRSGVSFPADMVSDSDPTEIDYVPVLALATAQAKAHNQQQDANIYFEEVNKYINDRATRRPPNIIDMCTKWLERAQFHAYFKYKQLRTEKWFEIPVDVGERIFDVPSADSKSLEMRYVSEAWLQDDNRWLPLKPGIDASLFNITQQTIPTRFELREFFEIFPIPNKAYTAWIKGHFGLQPFIDDADVTTIDPEVVLLQALVWGKLHFEHKDAVAQMKFLDDLIKRLNTGTHSGKRYIPNPDKDPVAQPYPQVTFART